MRGDQPVVGVGHGGEVPGDAGFFHLIADIAEKLPVMIGDRLRPHGKMLQAQGTAAEIGAVLGHDVEAGCTEREKVAPANSACGIFDAAYGSRFLPEEGDGVLDDLLFDAA